MGTSINDHLKIDNLSIEFLFLRKTSDSSIFTTYMVLGQLLCLKLKRVSILMFRITIVQFTCL